jgi:hypothetical protein
MKTIYNKCIAVLRTCNEFWILGLGLLLWSTKNKILRFIDNTAAPLDAGYFDTIYFTIIAFGAINLFIWIGMRLNFKILWSFLECDFNDTFKNLTPWQKMLVSFGFYALYLLSAVWVFSAVNNGIA